MEIREKPLFPFHSGNMPIISYGRSPFLYGHPVFANKLITTWRRLLKTQRPLAVRSWWFNFLLISFVDSFLFVCKNSIFFLVSVLSTFWSCFHGVLHKFPLIILNMTSNFDLAHLLKAYPIHIHDSWNGHNELGVDNSRSIDLFTAVIYHKIICVIICDTVYNRAFIKGNLW